MPTIYKVSHKVGRRYCLYCGFHDASQRTVVLYSLLDTCKPLGINPFDWLPDVLKRLPTCKQKER